MGNSKNMNLNKARNGNKNGRYIDGRSTYRQKIKIEMCYYCKSKEKLIIHHIDKNRLNNSKNNLRVLCNSCHNSLHHKGKEGSWKGKNIPLITKIKISKTKLAKYRSGEISPWNKGKKWSEDIKEKISKSWTREMKEKMAGSLIKDKKGRIIGHKK